MAYAEKLPAANTLTVLSALEATELPGLHDSERAKRNIKSMILERERIGLEKYGHTMDRDDFNPEKWAKELLQELCDGAQYANRAHLKAVMKDLLKIAIIVEDIRQNM